MEIAIILMFVIIFALFITGMLIKRKERIKERDEMFYEGDLKSEESRDIKKPKTNNSKKTKAPLTHSIDAVSEISKILSDEVEKISKPKGKKPVKKKKPEFPIGDSVIKPKSKRGRKPKNKDKKGGDQMLLS
jgi:hypothetical protein